MCNDYRLRRAYRDIAEAFSQLKLPLVSPALNLEPRDDIKITDVAPIVRMGQDGAEMVNRRWSWRGPRGAPVFNFKGEGRRFSPLIRCIIPADGFYEFTEPESGQKLKTKWLFSRPNGELLGIAGITRALDDTEAFTMLTVEPGPDVAPIHNRQIVLLPQEAWAPWLAGEAEAQFVRPSPEGYLQVGRA